MMREWRNEQLLKITECYKPQNIYNADETEHFFRLPTNKTLSLKGGPYNGGNNSKGRTTFLLAANATETGKLLLVVILKSENPNCFKNVTKFPTKYVAKRKAWVKKASFTDYLRTLNAKMSSQNRKILLFIDQCAAHPQNTRYLKNVKDVFLQTFNYSTRE
jgi:hypothetical protein